MSDVTVKIEGYGEAKLSIDLVDTGEEIEVWRGVFAETGDNPEVLWEVYFEMDPNSDYEIFDLINEAIYTYKLEAEEVQ